MKKVILSILFVITLYIPVQAQAELPRDEKGYVSAPEFYLDVLNYKAADTSATKIDIFVQVPYSNIQFIKNDLNFVAEYEVNLTVYDEDKDNILLNKTWKEDIIADNFNQTLSSNNFNLSLESLILKPDDYVLRCLIEDLNSNRTVTSEHKLSVLPFEDSVAISDILLVEDIQQGPSGEKIVPNISQTIESMDKLIQFYYEVYSNKEKEVEVVYDIRDKNKKQNFSSTVKKTLNKGKTEITETLGYEDFTFGEYDLLIRIQDTDNNLLTGIGKSFYAQIIGMPRTITDLDEAIDQMVYIASASELSEIERAETFEEKLEKYFEYWNSKDPTPNTPRNEVMLEYYRRVDYSNKNFEAYSRDGWKTDMGMVYIILGPPDYVERHPFAMDSKPYEVWDYHHYNRRFVFVDHTGFGDYRLLNNTFSDWNRYRY